MTRGGSLSVVISKPGEPVQHDHHLNSDAPLIRESGEWSIQCGSRGQKSGETSPTKLHL
jgi:hypothetical protein